MKVYSRGYSPHNEALAVENGKLPFKPSTILRRQFDAKKSSLGKKFRMTSLLASVPYSFRTGEPLCRYAHLNCRTCIIWLGMALRIQLRETGGFAGLQRLVALDGTTLRVLDRGQVRFERELPEQALRAVANQVTALESIRPRRCYGHAGYASDILTTELAIYGDSKGLEVEVVSDPEDPAPIQFWEVVNGLRKLIRSDAGVKIGDS